MSKISKWEDDINNTRNFICHFNILNKNCMQFTLYIRKCSSNKGEWAKYLNEKKDTKLVSFIIELQENEGQKE